MRAWRCSSCHLTTKDECMLFQKGKRTRILAKEGKELEALLRMAKGVKNREKQVLCMEGEWDEMRSRVIVASKWCLLLVKIGTADLAVVRQVKARHPS
ncbi:hypothetical protein E3N88_17754 [Mikania micrantha]|uniref:Uncharacterized protein n=1 Tax=Mikania micrantha TaxID=192012 RepID=A0A5N6NVG7_9ASTR|nr:hypothetical protein E3N88_17754 [Mikania micrantha]